MKTLLKPCRRYARPIGIFSAFASLLLLTGCFEMQRVFWSPDGQQAVVVTEKDGDLYFCDSKGELSEPLLSNVYTAAWFGDSQRLALAQQETYTNWSALAAVLTPERRENVRRLVDQLLAGIESGKNLDQLTKDAKESDKPFLDACALYARDELPERFQNALQNATNKVGDFKLGKIGANLSCLKIARVSQDHIEPTTVLAREFLPIWNIRVAPDNRTIAYTTLSEDYLFLSVAAVSGTQPAKPVDETVAAYPDWTTDSRSLVYIKAAGEGEQKDLALASVVRRQVVGTNGEVQVSKDKDELAGLLFNPLAKVRCLRDGRIIFAAAELQLPATANDMPQREQFFALDPERQATLTPLVPRGKIESLPESLGWFEVSPDQKRIAVGGEKCSVSLFTIASGNVSTVQPTTDMDTKCLPVWRTPDELCYSLVSSYKTPTNTEHQAQLVLWRNGETNVLSTNWPAEVRKELLE